MEFEVVNIKVNNEILELHPFRSVFWKRKEILIIADVHIGKITHFIHEGIYLPNRAIESNFLRLETLLNRYVPKELIVVGDLFHSRKNEEWIKFKDLISQFLDVKITLVMGNHEILEKEEYEKLGMSVEPEQMLLEPFLFTHEPISKPNKYFNVSGHLHPGVRLKGSGLQGMRLPCFYFSNTNAILPAFGTFTGKHVLKPKLKDRVFVVTNNSVINVSPRGELKKSPSSLNSF